MKNDKLEIVSQLQFICAEVFNEVTASLQPGMSEADIAKRLEHAFAGRGITEHWYDVPFNVLIGADRFTEGLMTTDYSVKSPSEKSVLKEGSILYIDFAPMDPATKTWGDWSRTVVFHPRPDIDDEEREFLYEVHQIQQGGIARITASMTGAEAALIFINTFAKQDMLLVDVRDNVGHSIHAGPKAEAKRVWLDLENTKQLGEGIFTVEPGASRVGKNGNTLVARFEDCIYIPPKGQPIVLGGTEAKFTV
jgi:Xaa-Pro aminopeptidase